ncbi:hypothetical protein BD414DRAFT_204306 [Trametes punicea]|nr:hypothetical protein BD414DRAFT_204306 [Trametes punicea]
MTTTADTQLLAPSRQSMEASRSFQRSEDAVAHARKVLEDQITAHADAIVYLKSQLNSMSPASRLPPEIISEIFTLVAVYHYEESWRHHYGSSQVYKWLPVAHVCRAWRAIALRTPRLWSNIVLTRPEVDHEVLSRAKNAPLWVSANITHQTDARAGMLDTIMQNPSRLRELQLMGPARALQSLSAKWTKRADFLQSISLTSPYRAFDHASVLSSPPFSPNLFSGHTPNLRHLDISGVTLDWSNPLFCPTLKTLKVDNRYDITDRLGEFWQLLDVLETMQSLETLQLIGAIPRLPEDAGALPEVRRSINLPKLRLVDLLSDAIDCARLLSHLSLPQDAKLLVTAHTERGVEELVRVLNDHLSRSKSFHTMRLGRRYNGQVHLRGWRSAVDPANVLLGSRSEPDMELSLDASPLGRSAQSLVGDSTFFSPIYRLEIEPTSRWNWRTLFNRTPELRELSLTTEPDDGFLPALSAILNTRGDDAGSISVPHLHTLELNGARFGCPHSDHESQWLEDMLEWLMLRYESGAPILQLVLRMCVNASREDVDRVREIVPDVQWDGRNCFERTPGTLASDEDEENVEDYYEDDALIFGLGNDDVYLADEDLELWMIPFPW